MMRRASGAAAGDVDRERELVGMVDSILARCEGHGSWDERVFDSVPEYMRPLHMPAVREAMGALVPAALHKSLDAAAKKVKDVFGQVRGGCALRMDKWVVNVSAETALSEGRLQADAHEFFLKVIQRACKVLNLPVAVASRKVGRHVGAEESPTHFVSVASGWRSVWDFDAVKDKKELLLTVAVDSLDSNGAPQDWLFVSVTSACSGQTLGAAGSLKVRVFDTARRSETAKRIAVNVDALVRSASVRSAGGGPEVVLEDDAHRGVNLRPQRLSRLLA